MTFIRPEWIEVVARTLHHINTGSGQGWDLDQPAFRSMYRDHAYEVLSAVASPIAAQALRDAANAPLCANVPDGEICLACDARMFLRESADRIEAGQ